MRSPQLIVPWKVILLDLVFVARMVFAQSNVEYLPGFSGKLPFKLETGYIGVGESEEMQLFYYFVESERNPENDPLIFWLTGGPGCSGFFSIVSENGPFTFEYVNFGEPIPKVVLNPYSWTKVANIIFIDQPAGTGYSYGKTDEAYKMNDTLAGMTTYEFLIKWLINHPKYLDNPLYIGGGSYSGIFVPLIVDLMYKDIEAENKPHLNMKGYILANPITDHFIDFNGRVLYAHRMGLLSDELYLSAKRNCNGSYLNVDRGNYLCNADIVRINQCLQKINWQQILEPWCDGPLTEKDGMLLHHVSSLFEESASRRSLQSYQKAWSCRDRNAIFPTKWANIKLVQQALNVREGTLKEWVRCSATIQKTYVKDVKSTVKYHKKFTYKDMRVLIYSGDHDIGAPHTSTEEWIRSMKLQIKSDWRPWFVEGQIAGYTTAYLKSNYELTYATVKGAGHTPSEYKPLECLVMIEKWLNHDPL